MKAIRSIAVILLTLFGACVPSIAKQDAETTGLSIHMMRVVERATSAVIAYQVGDKETWERLVCQSPIKHSLEKVTSFIGFYDKPKIILISDQARASNLVSTQEFKKVVFEGYSQKYPTPDHLMALTFLDLETGCLHLSF